MKQIIPLCIVLVCGSAHAVLASSGHGGEAAIDLTAGSIPSVPI